MTAQDIFDKWQKKRDFSGSSDDEYAQLLVTLEAQAVAGGWYSDFKRMLISAEKEGKRLNVKYAKPEIKDEIRPDDVVTA